MDIKILHTTFLAGPNLWCYKPAFEAYIDIGRFEQFPSNLLDGFATRLAHKLPGLYQHRCGVGTEGAFVQRLHEGTWIGHIIEHVAIELQILAGVQVGFGKTRETSQPNVYKVVFRAGHERIGHFALHAAIDLILAMVNNLEYDLESCLKELGHIIDAYHIAPSMAPFIEAAEYRSIPWIRLTDNNLVQFGHGHLLRHIRTAVTDKNEAIGTETSCDTHVTKTLLKSAGIPVHNKQDSNDTKAMIWVNDLFPAHEQGRIPIVGITGSRNTTLIAPLVAHILSSQYHCVGLAASDGLYVGSHQLFKNSAVYRQAGEQLLTHQSVDAAVIENDALQILNEGLAYDRCSMGIVTDLTMQEGYDTFYVNDPDDLFKVLRTQIDVVLPTGVAVLNADDPYVLEMIPLCDGQVILYSQFSSLEKLKLNHSEYTCVFLSGQYISKSAGSEEQILIDTRLLSANLASEIEAVLVAVAASIAFDVNPDVLLSQLNTFKKVQ